tara:strand:+ start:131 stop:367 length:237 start_codon:yes stop_codon:yes gene_type:complete
MRYIVTPHHSEKGNKNQFSQKNIILFIPPRGFTHRLQYSAGSHRHNAVKHKGLREVELMLKEFHGRKATMQHRLTLAP